MLSEIFAPMRPTEQETRLARMVHPLVAKAQALNRIATAGSERIVYLAPAHRSPRGETGELYAVRDARELVRGNGHMVSPWASL